MLTRATYMANSQALHRAYYAQFVTPAIFRMVERRFTAERLVRCSDQEFFNTIPLHQWDILAPSAWYLVDRDLLRAAGEGWSLGTAVCILKEAARQVVENHWSMEAA